MKCEALLTEIGSAGRGALHTARSAGENQLSCEQVVTWGIPQKDTYDTAGHRLDDTSELCSALLIDRHQVRIRVRVYFNRHTPNDGTWSLPASDRVHRYKADRFQFV